MISPELLSHLRTEAEKWNDRAPGVLNRKGNQEVISGRDMQGPFKPLATVTGTSSLESNFVVTDHLLGTEVLPYNTNKARSPPFYERISER